MLITPYYERARRFLTEDVSEMRDDEFERLYEAEAQGLFGFLAYRTGDRALAEDLLADTFERALRARAASTAAAARRRRGCTRSRSTCCATTRAGRRPRARALERAGRRPPARAELGDAVEHRDVVQRALATLSAEEREAIALRFGADLTVPEIAEALRRAADHRRGPRLPRAAQASGELAE